MVLGSETDSTFANFNYECGPGRETSCGRQGDNTPSPTYGRRAVPARPPYLRAVAAGAPEIWIVGNHYVTAVLSNKPAGPLHHQSEVITQNAVWTVNYIFSHRASPLNILRAFK